MRIRGWHIDGFGVFHDWRVTDLPDGLTVVYGENEAGKSTLLAFLRGVLFGYPDRRGGEEQYPPLRGGRFGGAVEVEQAGGIYRVERTAAGRRRRLAVVRPDGSEGDDGDLRRLLGGADATSFKSVFAFGLQELSELSQLSGQEVANVIFSAGVAGAGRSARAVLDELEKEAQQLLKLRGAATINDLAAKMKDVRARIDDAKAVSAGYGELVAREREAHAEIARLKEEIAVHDVRSRDLARLLEHWGVESERQRCVAELHALEVVDEFPADAGSRFTAAVERLRGATTDCHETAARLATLEASRTARVLDATLDAMTGEIAALAEELPLQRERLRRQGELQTALDHRERELRAVVGALGPEWTQARVRSFDSSLPSVETVREWQRELDEASRAADAAGQRQEEAGRQAAKFEEQLGRATAGRPWDEAEDAAGLEPIVTELELLTGSPAAEARQAVAALRRAESDLDSMVRAEEAARRQFAPAPADSRFDVAVLADVAALAGQVEVQRDRLRRLGEARRVLAAAKEAAGEAVRELGPEWDEPRIARLDCGARQARRAGDFADRLQAACEAVTEARHQVDTTTEGRLGLEKDLERLRERIAATRPGDAARLREEAMALRRIRTRMGDLLVAESELRSAEALQRERAAAASMASPAPAPVPAWLRSAAIVAATAVAAGAAWRAAVGDTLLALGLALLAVSVGLIAWLARPRSPGAAPASPLADTLLQEARDAAAGAAQRRDAARRLIADDALRLALPDQPSIVEVEERQEAWQAEHDRRRWHDAMLADLEALGEKLRQCSEAEAGRRERLRRAQAAEEAVAREWEAWTRENDLPSDLAPRAALELLQQVRAARGLIERRTAAAEALDVLQRDVEAWERRARALLVLRPEVVPGDGSELVDALVRLDADCSTERVRRDEQARLAREADRLAILVLERREALRHERVDAAAAVRSLAEGVMSAWEAGRGARDEQRTRTAQVVAAQAEVERRWRAWKEARGLDAVLSPQGVIDFFQRVEAARQAIEARDTAVEALRPVIGAIEEWQERVRALLERWGAPCPPRAAADHWIDGLRDLAARCAANRQAALEAERLENEIASARLAQEGAERKRGTAVADLAALFREAGADDEGSFRGRLALHTTRRELQGRSAALEAQLVKALGVGATADRFRAELTTGRVADWQTEQTAVRERLEERRTAHDEAIRRQQETTLQRRRIEDAADVADLELQYQGLASDLASAVERWRVVTLARGLVERTLREFERTRQPAVLAMASAMFERVTAGRYARVVQDEGDERLAVIDRAGARRRLRELSRGTAEQLYLCVRLGLAREFGRRAETLPLVMDDVLVNFDAGRARTMARELLEFSRENQVLLFTCHTFTRDLFASLDPGVRIDQLSPATADALWQASLIETA